MGLSLFTWIKIAIVTLALIYSSINLKLSPNSPLFLFLGIIWMIITAFIIKSSLDDEVEGFYTSFITHPFLNHLFKAFPNHEGYDSLYTMQNLKTINIDHAITKEGDLLAFIKLSNGISWNKTSIEDRKRILENWSNYLAQIQSISAMDSYLLNSNCFEDSIQSFIWIKPYHAKYNEVDIIINDHNINQAQSINKIWHQQTFHESKFIANPEFYIILRHKNNINKTKISYKLLSKWLPQSYINQIFNTQFKPEELEAEFKLFDQKINSCISVLAGINIHAERLRSSELTKFCDYWLATDHILNSSCNDNPFIIKDEAKYIQFNNRYQKTYRIACPPETGDLDFWLLNYIPLFNSEAYISIQLSPRDPHRDRRKAESKSEIMKQLSRNNKMSTLSIIQENQKISENLINKPFSFDLVIYIGIISDSIESIQDMDNIIRKPIKLSKLASLDRQQIPNWLYSLPFSYNKLKDKEKLFANLDFATSCFPFVDNNLGTNSGALLGIALDNAKPVYFNEYDRDYCNNRGINFIGDSGSGKTVAAKLAIKRRLVDSNKSFYIIDNTEDGWKFFIDYFSGTIIEIDKYGDANDGRPLFAPFKIPADHSQEQFNNHLEGLISLLGILKEDQAKICASEKLFLTQSIKTIYQANDDPCLSDLYKLWQASEHESSKKWLDIIAPYSRVSDGIYSKLMDGTQAYLDDQSRLILFTFSKLNRDSNFLPVSLYLVSNFINQKVLYEKQAQTTLVIDEAWKIFTGKHSERGKELLSHFARAGRGLDLGLWNISQKPSDLPREIHSSASATICFQLKEASDRAEMSSYSSLNINERALLESPALFEAGNALVKTTRASGLIQIILDPYEEVLCNSNREFVNRRNKLFTEFMETYKLSSAEAAYKTIEVLCHH